MTSLLKVNKERVWLHLPEIEGIFSPEIGKKQLDLSSFPSIDRDYNLGDEVQVLSIDFKELDFTVAVSNKPGTLGRVKKIYQENDQSIKNMIKGCKRDNSKVEDVLFNGTTKHDLNVYMALEVALYCDSINQTGILVNIVRNSYQRILRISNETSPYYAMKYLGDNLLSDKKLMHNTEELLSNLAAINFLFKTGSEDYSIDNALKGAHGTTFYPLYNMKRHKAEQRDDKLGVKKMRELLDIGFVEPNSKVTITLLATTNNNGKIVSGLDDSDTDILSKSYFSLCGGFADLVGIGSYLANNFEIKGSELSDIVYFVLISLCVINQNAEYRQIDYLPVFYSLLYQFALTRLSKNAKEELILNSDYEIAKRIVNIRKGNKSGVIKLKRELNITSREGGRLKSLVKSTKKEEELLKQKIKELKGIRKELEQLRFENKVLRQLQEQEHRQSLNGKTEEPSLSEMITYLKHKNILLARGYVNFQGKLTELLPNVKMFDVSENNGKILKSLDTCDAIFLYTNYLSHDLYYRIMSEISNKNKIFYLDNHVSMSLTIKYIYDLSHVYKH